MELRDYVDIFKKQLKAFSAIVVLSVLGAFVWQQNQPVRYQATLLLNIGRASVQETEQYTYDSFYRLQADERFADTVVRWLSAPRIVEDIYEASGIDRKGTDVRDLKNTFAAKRLSSQVVEAAYAHPDEKTLRVIAESAVAVLNRYAESLNQENGEPHWFVVVGSDPVISDERVPLSLALSIGLALGMFSGFWGALFRHYYRAK